MIRDFHHLSIEGMIKTNMRTNVYTWVCLEAIEKSNMDEV